MKHIFPFFRTNFIAFPECPTPFRKCAARVPLGVTDSAEDRPTDFFEIYAINPNEILHKINFDLVQCAFFNERLTKRV